MAGAAYTTDKEVSEELNSVETAWLEPHIPLIKKFQKNLIVWKLDGGGEFGIRVEGFRRT